MFESWSGSVRRSAVLDHAGEVAQWVVLLLGWLWLGAQGQRLGWSLASGVVAVALWWSLRVACRGRAWVRQCHAEAFLGCGLLTAVGVCLMYGLEQGVQARVAAQASLFAVAAVWGLWGAMVETRSRVSTFQLSALAWHPVLAALGVLGVWRFSAGAAGIPLGAAVLLALSALVLYARDRCAVGPLPACRGPHVGVVQLLAPSAMGLMMGTLWLGNTWCVGLGITAGDMVMLHVGLMAVLPAVVAWALRGRVLVTLSAAAQVQASLIFLALGAAMFLGNSVMHSLLAMLLPSLAWALHCARERSMQPRPMTRLSPDAVRVTALLMGPVVLVVVGWASPVQGPWAVRAAMAGLGVLAACHALLLWWDQRCWR